VKEVDLPKLLLVFNSPRRVLKMPGFPCLYKEIAEIIECGNLTDGRHQFRSIEYIKCIEKFSNIE